MLPQMIEIGKPEEQPEVTIEPVEDPMRRESPAPAPLVPDKIPA